MSRTLCFIAFCLVFVLFIHFCFLFSKYFCCSTNVVFKMDRHVNGSLSLHFVLYVSGDKYDILRWLWCFWCSWWAFFISLFSCLYHFYQRTFDFGMKPMVKSDLCKFVICKFKNVALKNHAYTLWKYLK